MPDSFDQFPFLIPKLPVQTTEKPANVCFLRIAEAIVHGNEADVTYPYLFRKTPSTNGYEV